MANAYIGIDVQVKRPCAFAVVDEEGMLIESGWFQNTEEGLERLEPWAKRYQLHIGIDAPRIPITQQREWYWNGSKKTWRKRTASDKGMGRHCEVVIKAHKLGNPQWTTTAETAPEWMDLGFELFRKLDKLGCTYEAFPSASYVMLENDPSVKLTISFSQMRPGPKDMLDAWMAAATVREFMEGRGMAVGDGDGLGAIILPRPIANPIDGVLKWPD